jgi:hypothetical protein
MRLVHRHLVEAAKHAPIYEMRHYTYKFGHFFRFQMLYRQIKLGFTNFMLKSMQRLLVLLRLKLMKLGVFIWGKLTGKFSLGLVTGTS